MIPCLPRPRKRGTLHGLRLMLPPMGGCRTTSAAAIFFVKTATKAVPVRHTLDPRNYVLLQDIRYTADFRRLARASRPSTGYRSPVPLDLRRREMPIPEYV